MQRTGLVGSDGESELPHFLNERGHTDSTQRSQNKRIHWELKQ